MNVRRTCSRCTEIAEEKSVFCKKHKEEVIENLQLLNNVIRKNKEPPCKDCGASTIKEAHHLCKRKKSSDTCHGCSIWPPTI
jgi:hypothetical protein